MKGYSPFLGFLIKSKDQETFLENKYKAKLNVYFNEVSLNSFFGERNLLFSNPKNLSVIFYPILLV